MGKQGKKLDVIYRNQLHQVWKARQTPTFAHQKVFDDNQALYTAKSTANLFRWFDRTTQDNIKSYLRGDANHGGRRRTYGDFHDAKILAIVNKEP